jgi:hypothetical protein
MIDSNLQERFDPARTHVPEKEQVIIHANDSNLVENSTTRTHVFFKVCCEGKKKKNSSSSSSSSELNLQILERAQ